MVFKKNIVFYVIKKYLRFNKSQPFITVTALLAFAGISIGVMALMISVAIITGVTKDFEEKLLTFNYPLTVLPRTSSRANEDILSKLQSEFKDMVFSPYIRRDVVAKKGDMLEGGSIFGIRFNIERHQNSILDKALGDNEKIKDFNLVIGGELKNRFFLKDGGSLDIIFTNNTVIGFSLVPNIKRFKVIGSFTSGLYNYDMGYMYTTLNSLARILNYPTGEFDGIHIFTKNPFNDIKKVQDALPHEFTVIGWWQFNQSLFSALSMEKTALFLVLMLIIIIASLNIISSLLMTIMNRRSEIALLLSLGVKKKEIRNIFFIIGIIIGISGIAFGTILGFIGIYLLGTFDIISLPADIYGTSKLPIDLSPIDFFHIIIGALVVIVLSSYYPSYKASKIDALKILRNE